MPTVDCNGTECFLCAHCLPEWKEVIALRRETLHFKKGQTIFSEGDPVEGMYFMTSGAVKIHRQWGRDKELILRFAAGGEVLGYRGHTGSAATGSYPVSATALEPATACYIPQSFLEATFRANPDFLYRMMQLYADALQQAEQRMRHLALTEVKGRIADALLTIRETLGINEDGFISVPVTRHDIAAYAGTTYETVFKLFSEWTQSGVIDTSGKFIRILNEDALREVIPL